MNTSCDNERLLNRFQRNVFSQGGEDGVIEKILEELPERNKWCVEFGAWDGRHLSNTHNLIQNHGFSAVIIESNPDRYRALQNTYANNPSAMALNRFVASKGRDSLDNILRGTRIPKEFDFLSIDIDGNDYFVWESVKTYRPRVVCIEFNPTIPEELEFVQEDNPNVKQGASLLSLYQLGKSKGYELVCVLPWNAIFVDKRYYPLFGIGDNSPRALRQDRTRITYLFSGYDGKLLTRGFNRLAWHDISFGENELQILPRAFRKYALEFTPLEAFAFGIYKWARRTRHRILARISRAFSWGL